VQRSSASITAQIEIGQPKVFTLGAVLIISAYGITLAVPVVIALLVVSVLKLGALTILIPLLSVALAAIILPLGLGNPYVTRLVRSLQPAPDKAGTTFVVQLRASPRIRSGPCALLEDADDVGCLSFDGAGFRFEGDSVRLSVPYACVKEVRPCNIGLRGLFVYGRRIVVEVTGLAGVSSLEFAERSSWLLPTSRRITRQLHKHLANQ
jgi:hypothetical protein